MASTTPYSAEWYYKLYPGFYNQACYDIMADYSANPEKYQFTEIPEMDEGVEETKENQPPDLECGVNDECELCDVCAPIDGTELNKNAKRKIEELEPYPFPFECETV